MKRKIIFPPVETASEDGLVAVGGDLDVDTLIEAYQKGIFPWPLSTHPFNLSLPNTWFSPDPRGVLFFSDLHLSKSFKKFLKKSPFSISFNKAFEEVIKNCASIPRNNEKSTWITPEIINSYLRLFQKNLAYSVEVWRGDKLVGGLYGVMMGSFVSGESMFSLETNASKHALYELIEKLQKKNISWMDTQMVTPVVRQFGGKYIPRPVFLKMLEKTNWTRKRSDILD